MRFVSIAISGWQKHLPNPAGYSFELRPHVQGALEQVCFFCTCWPRPLPRPLPPVSAWPKLIIFSGGEVAATSVAAGAAAASSVAAGAAALADLLRLAVGAPLAGSD